jgi:hypothetical protein
MAADFMENRARLRSRLGWCLLLCLAACQPRPADRVTISTVFVSAEAPGWQRREGQLLLLDTLFSGWYYQLRATGDTAFVGSYWAGKPEGTHRIWHENGQLKEVRHYEKGWQEGEQQGWFASGKRAFRYSFRHDVYEGAVTEWYPNGRTARFMHYHEGQENGRQQMWFTDGSLQANYVVRKSRTYGFTGVKNCVTVSDSLYGTR